MTHSLLFFVFCLLRTVPLFARRAPILPMFFFVLFAVVRFTDFCAVLRGGRFVGSFFRIPSNGLTANFTFT